MKNIIKRLIAILFLIGLILFQAIAKENSKTITVHDSDGRSITINVASIVGYIEVGESPEKLWSKLIYRDIDQSLDEIKILDGDNLSTLNIGEYYEDILEGFLNAQVSLKEFEELENVKTNVGYHRVIINKAYREIYAKELNKRALSKKLTRSMGIYRHDYVRLNPFDMVRPNKDEHYHKKLDYLDKYGVNKDNQLPLERAIELNNDKVEVAAFQKQVKGLQESSEGFSMLKFLRVLGRVAGVVIIGGGLLIALGGGGQSGGSSGGLSSGQGELN